MKLNQNIHRIGENAFNSNGKTAIVIPYIDFDIKIILLEQIIQGKFRIETIDEVYDEDDDELNVLVRTNIPWNYFMTIPDPNLKYLKKDNLN